MSQNTNLEGLMDSSLKNLKSLVDVNTVIGDPITTADGTVIIPVSKVSFGFASGGTDLPTQKPKDLFGGGSGAGVSITPLAFLVVSGGSVRLVQMEKFDNTADRAINMVPEVIDKIVDLIGKSKKTPPAHEMPNT